MIFDDILTKHGVPALNFNSMEEFEVKRSEIKDIIMKNIYGYLPEPPEHMSCDLYEEDQFFAAGKARCEKLQLKLYKGERSFSFPLSAVIPKNKEKVPAFIFINTTDSVPDRYLPSEEISDGGFAVFSFCCEDISPDTPNFAGNISSFLAVNRRFSSSPGKIMLWAYAAMRVMDYVETLDFIDKDNIAIIGHSKLAKAALVAGAFDNRFAYAISNNSGCSGAAITHGKSGESIHDITNRYPYWFCQRYRRVAANFMNEPIDQNLLLSLIAPRRLIIGSAEGDWGSDPKSEFLGAYSVSKLYELYGLGGLIHENEFPKAPALLDKGCICYHLREGYHYLSRDDWRVYMGYISSCTEVKNDL